MKPYKPSKLQPPSIFEEPMVAYSSLDDSQALDLINIIRKGLQYKKFEQLYNQFAFSLTDWSSILHLSERTMQRYENENKAFDAVQSEKIIQVVMLHKYGISVFGSQDKFNAWLHTKNIGMGGIIPKELLDSSIGIDLVKDELGRIEHGILA
jgi:putative toxin-antitoxin system antitoxin component (TIGR02293 family)